MDLNSPSTQKQIFPHWVKSSVLHGCSTFTLCEEQLPVSTRTFLHIWSSGSKHTWTCNIWDRISHQDSPFSILTNRSSFHLSLQKAQRKTPNFSCDVHDFCHTPTSPGPYSFAAGLRVITMQCLAASLMDPHCETACADPGDKNPCSWWLCESLLGD